MPGMNFICSLNGHLAREMPRVREALRSQIHEQRWEQRQWLKSDYCYLECTAYPEYPMERFEFGEVIVCVEGRLYGIQPNAKLEALRELAELAFTSNGKLRSQLLEWVTVADGDFVVVLFHKAAQEIVIINDLFGRLPLYCYQTANKLVLSRDLHFVCSVAGLKRPDPMALAQYLIFGYPLGKRTLLENVDRLPPATCIKISHERSRIFINQLHQFNCELKAENQGSVRDNAHELVDLFSRACTARASDRDPKNVISLSGGFDSRAIAACFHKLGIHFRAATFLDPWGRAEADIPVAREIAGLLGAEWKLFSLNAASARAVLRLLQMKTGMNPLYLAFLLEFLDQIRTMWGSDLVFFSGEIGDRLLPDRRPRRNLGSLEELVNYLINEEPKFSLNTVSTLTKLKSEDIVDELGHHISSYPEQNWMQKYVHFTTFERVFKWQSEGEDRNRNYFWIATPYAGIDFVNFASRCSDDQKLNYGLYREFLNELSPAAATAAHAGTGAAITSKEFTTIRKALGFLQERPDIRVRLEPLRRPSRQYDHDPMTLKYLHRQMRDSDFIFEYLSAGTLRNIVDNPGNYTKEAIDLLFTVSASIEHLTTGGSILQKLE